MASISINYTIEDNKGKKSTMTVNVPSGTTMPDLIEFAADLADLIVPLVSGGIVGISACLNLGSTPAQAAIAAGSDVEEGGLFTFRTVNGFPTRVRIPTFLESKVVVGTDQVDETDPDVAAWVAAMLDGLVMTSTNVVQPSDYREEDVVTLAGATESFTKSRR